MRHLGSMAAAGLALALGGLCATSAAAAGDAPAGSPTAARPALWRTYDMIVSFESLPRTYTCDQLWYEFHGILRRLGAWPYSINILPYDCSPSPSGVMRSPHVQVRFQLPFFLQATAAKWAPARATERSVRLAPGEPETLHASDCQLMRQISRYFLTSIPVRIDEEHFDCSAAPPRSGSFHVTVTLPMAVKMPAPAATSAQGPR